mmetsp:Transcript_19971/g.30428  ORF Transcript_19971/g.30428 Transcript_19971/m.30428 type:complete len:267 (-) Transcript_19971:75-875(-)
MRTLSLLVAIAAASISDQNNNMVAALSTISKSSSTSRIRNPPPSPLFPLLESSTVEKEHISLPGSSDNNSNNLSPFLQEMVDEQRELQMNVGKAMDTLRKDYPDFLSRTPDYSLYHENISLKASDGQIQLSKLTSYKKALGLVRSALSLVYDADRSIIQSRMVYDPTRTELRVSYNAMLVPKIMGVTGRTVHVDGISIYAFDLSASVDREGKKNEGAGKIREHRIEKLLVNGAAMQPPYFNNFGLEALVGQRSGALVGAGAWSFEQ